MLKLTPKTLAIVAGFTATATTFFFAGCAEETASGEQTVLKDDAGETYTLRQNSDGTETADYGDGREVTFRREDDGTLSPISGTAGLLTGLAAGYFLFHGFQLPSGSHFDTNTNRYVVNGTPQKITGEKRRQALSTYVPSSSTRTSTEKAATAKGSAKSTAQSPAKSGFGSAGARGGGAS